MERRGGGLEISLHRSPSVPDPCITYKSRSQTNFGAASMLAFRPALTIIGDGYLSTNQIKHLAFAIT